MSDKVFDQIEEHIKAVVSLFHYTLINGDAAATSATNNLPDFNKPGVVKNAEVEMIAAAKEKTWFKEHDGYEVVEQ